MTTTFDHETFDEFYDRDSGALFSDLAFDRCTFLDPLLSKTFNPALRSIVRSVILRNCRARQGDIGTAIVEDVVIDGLKIDSVVFGWGAVFQHVTLKGRIDGQLILNWLLDAMGKRPEQSAFDVANAEYYRNVDWALDLSEASFNLSPDIDAVPGRLIRRDPETQVLVTRERLADAILDGLDLGVSGFEYGLQSLVREGRDSVVLVAPKRHAQFDEYMEALALVRKNGWAEND